jgi:hypothetical protein
MPIDQILLLLISERDKLNRAIEALQGSAKRLGRPAASATNPTPQRKGRPPMSAAERKAASERMKKFWEARRKAKR